MKIFLVGAAPFSVVHFRGDLIRGLVDQGHEVTVMTAETVPDVQARIENLGVRFIPFPVQRNGMNFRADLQTRSFLKKTFHHERPDLILAYTIKPIIWGGIAVRSVPGTRFFAMVTGLGYAFQGNSPKRRLLNRLVTSLYRFSLRRAKGVIFQNSDNRDVFISRKIVDAGKCHVVSGSGINLQRFEFFPLPSGDPHFLLIARLLGEKGVREYAAAAAIVKQRFPQARFSLVGPTDPSPDGIPLDEVETWHKEGIIKYHGATDDVRPFIQESHIYCLPSYHEGMPRSVLEGMAMGRPILTTDVCGCRETVQPGHNGWLVPHANAGALADRMVWFIENRDRWEEMGKASRKLAEARFDVKKVNEEMMRIMFGTDGAQSSD
jgi:glycosyltransferase involved in cell wall biosynthesis